MSYNRNIKGQFASTKWIKRGIYVALALIAWMIFVHPAMLNWVKSLNTASAKYSAPEVAEAANPEVVYVPDQRVVEQMKKDLIDIVWDEESKKHAPAEGEIFFAFDPSSKQYQECIRIGGSHPKDCMSYGPMQIKLGTIQHYAQELYGKELNDKEARDIAESLEGSQDFFIRCTVKIKGCVWNWTGATKHRSEVETLVKYIREYEG